MYTFSVHENASKLQYVRRVDVLSARSSYLVSVLKLGFGVSAANTTVLVVEACLELRCVGSGGTLRSGSALGRAMSWER